MALAPEECLVEQGSWLCEMALWTVWFHRGDGMAGSSSEIFTVAQNDFEALILNSGPLFFKVSRHAHNFVEWMNAQDVDGVDDLSTGQLEGRLEMIERATTAKRGLMD